MRTCSKLVNNSRTITWRENVIHFVYYSHLLSTCRLYLLLNVIKKSKNHYVFFQYKKSLDFYKILIPSTENLLKGEFDSVISTRDNSNRVNIPTDHRSSTNTHQMAAYAMSMDTGDFKAGWILYNSIFKMNLFRDYMLYKQTNTPTVISSVNSKFSNFFKNVLFIN